MLCLNRTKFLRFKPGYILWAFQWVASAPAENFITITISWSSSALDDSRWVPADNLRSFAAAHLTTTVIYLDKLGLSHAIILDLESNAELTILLAAPSIQLSWGSLYGKWTYSACWDKTARSWQSLYYMHVKNAVITAMARISWRLLFIANRYAKLTKVIPAERMNDALAVED